jgi:hypothetical protein
MKTIRSVFDEQFPNLIADKKLAEELHRFRIAFANKNNDHLEFFGGNLTGVHVIRFSDKDFSTFFNEILNINMTSLAAELKKVEAIDANWKIASDVFNLTCIYLIHVFLVSKQLTPAQREEAAINIGIIFNYRCISALMNYYFKYPIDKKLAEAVYSTLSKHFLLKRLGTWQDVMVYRAESIISKTGIHRKALENFDNDASLINVMNDSQGRIRDTMKNYYKYFIKVHSSGDRYSTSTSVGMSTDGTLIIKDRINGLSIYSDYIYSVLTDKQSFIRQELLDIVVDIIYTVQLKQFIITLEWLSDNYYVHENASFVDSIIKKIMVHSYHYLIDNRYILNNKKDIAGLLTRLRGIYTSSRSSDSDLLELRVLGDKLVKLAIGDITAQATSSIRTSVFLYISLRAYTKSYYTGKE